MSASWRTNAISASTVRSWLTNSRTNFWNSFRQPPQLTHQVQLIAAHGHGGDPSDPRLDNRRQIQFHAHLFERRVQCLPEHPGVVSTDIYGRPGRIPLQDEPAAFL